MYNITPMYISHNKSHVKFMHKSYVNHSPYGRGVEYAVTGLFVHGQMAHGFFL